MRLGVRAVGEARQSKWCWVNERQPTHHHVCHQPPGAGPDAETVTGKSSRDEETRYLIDGRNDGDRIGCHINHAGPSFSDTNGAESGKGFNDPGARPCNEEAVWSGVEHSHLLEG